MTPSVKEALKYKESGSGRNAIGLARKGFLVTAVDKNKEKLSLLKIRARELGVKLTTKYADIKRLRLSTKYDIMIATMILHFLDEGQVSKAISMMQKYTKAEGLNIVSVFTDKHPVGTRPYLFKKNELKKYYLDWKILKYEEKLSRKFFSSRTNTFVRQHRAVLIAQKIKK